MATLLIRRYAVALGTGPSDPSPVILQPWYRTHALAQAHAEALNKQAAAGLLDQTVPPGSTFFVSPDRTGFTVSDNVSTEEMLAEAAVGHVNVEVFVRFQNVAGGSYIGAFSAEELLRIMRTNP